MTKRWYNDLERRFGTHLGVGDRYLLRRVVPFAKDDVTEKDVLSSIDVKIARSYDGEMIPRTSFPVIQLLKDGMIPRSANYGGKVVLGAQQPVKGFDNGRHSIFM
mgnify:CR=1 FL=1